MLIAASNSNLEVNRRLMTTVQLPANAEFRHDTLDDALASALNGYPSSGFAVSAA